MTNFSLFFHIRIINQDKAAEHFARAHTVKYVTEQKRKHDEADYGIKNKTPERTP